MKKAKRQDEAKAKQGKRPQPVKQRDDSDDIERAVYDGMQDLRVKKPK